MIKKTIVGVLAVLGLFFVSSQVYIDFFLDCHSVLKGEVVSPDGKYEARYINRICEEDPPKIEVWVGKINSNSSTLAFSALASTTIPLRISWSGPENLSIDYPDAIIPSSKYEKIEGVSIDFNSFRGNGT